MSSKSCSPRLIRGLKSAVSVVAMLAGAMVPAEAIADDVTTVDSPIFADVYGNNDGRPWVRVDSSPSGHTLKLENGAGVEFVFGASVDGGGASNNGVSMTGGQVMGDLYGAFSGNGVVDHNKVDISGGTVDDSPRGSGSVFGGYVGTGSATGNTVDISGGMASGYAYGGYTEMGNATDNSVTIGGNAKIGDQTQGIISSVEGGYAIDGAASSNSVTINGAAVITGDVNGGYSASGDTNYNSVTVNGGTVGGTLKGGCSMDHGTASYNTVTISGGTVKQGTSGGYATNGDAKYNVLNVSGGTVAVLVGGSAEAGGYNASHNEVNISGGAVVGMLIAGGAIVGGSATYNTVTISGAPSISSSTSLYGGSCMGSCSDVFSGNTLNLKTTGLTVASLSNFEFLNFYLPTTFSATGGAVLKVTGTANLTNGSNLTSTGPRSSEINVGINGASSALAVGDTVTLISADKLIPNEVLNKTATGSGMLGVTLDYVFGISVSSDDKNLFATVQDVGVSEESKALSEGFISGASFVNQGSDLASGKGMANAISAAEAGWSSFGAVSGGSIRSETGSHVDVTGVSLMAGLSGDAELSIGRLTAGVFAEYGNGSFDTFNGFSSGNVRGEGDSAYIGGGLLGHADFKAMGPGHAYAEASARLGSSHTSFSSADLVSGGVAAGYDSSSLYYGASAAVGYVWTLNEATTVDISGKVLWSRLGGDSTQLTTGDTVDFDAVNSERTRLGARVSYALTDLITPYAGAAWEHEFDGKSRATTNGLTIDAPSMRGDTGIFEAGLTLTPSDDLPLTVDLGLQGFVGQREGIAGSFQAKLAF